MAYPLIAVALIQLVVGGTVAFRTDAQVATLVQQLSTAPAAFQTAEVPRMEAVMRNFELYKAIELVLLLAGVALTYAFRRKELVYGIGVGLVVQASLMLVLDLFAEKRGDEYLAALRELPTASAPAHDVQ
jgi:3-dehydroquinate synthetase